MTPSSPRRGHTLLRPALLALAAAVCGGICGWTLAFSGLKLWGLAAGAVLTLALAGSLAWRPSARPALPAILGYSFALVLLTWPPLWLVVGYVRYLLTGQALGN